mmetsp:Transcript_41337/g.82824  ORF Transcript_41337/g.82824 Transcript_41337/m.82824 type:complete len:84 (-) Transcript_41337:806-1057(-)
MHAAAGCRESHVTHNLGIGASPRMLGQARLSAARLQSQVVSARRQVPKHLGPSYSTAYFFCFFFVFFPDGASMTAASPSGGSA